MAAKQKTKPREAAEPTAAYLTTVAVESQTKALLPASLSLKLLVFVAGAVLMGLEIVGSRFLAPFYGNSVFVWGSLISLFLIALSLGYYFGGRIADRRPSRVLLNSIVTIVALLMFAVAFLADPVCEAILQADFGERSGPFLASVVLFLLPSIGMGMVSPFAIRLATHTVASVGKTAGTLYALSTLGSIAGTVLTTFVLIPSIGAETILTGLAGALLITAILTFPFGSRGAAVAGTAAGILLAVGFVFLAATTSQASLPLGRKSIREIDTPYHHISVVDDRVRRSRELRFDRYVESSIDLDPPHASHSAYTRYFHLALAANPQMKRVLFIGAGGGVGPRAFHLHNPAMEIDVVDIDQKVLDVARSDFFMPDVPQIRSIAADGRMFVRDAPAGHYDAIFLDAFTIGGRIPFHLVTREFFELCQQKLAPDGIFIMNINSAQRGENSQIFQSMYKTIVGVFPKTQAFAVARRLISPELSTNILLVAFNGERSLAREDWVELAAAYDSASYVDRRQVELMVDDLLPALPDVTAAAEFTDDYAPIETMPF